MFELRSWFEERKVNRVDLKTVHAFLAESLDILFGQFKVSRHRIAKGIDGRDNECARRFQAIDISFLKLLGQAKPESMMQVKLGAASEILPFFIGEGETDVFQDVSCRDTS